MLQHGEIILIFPSGTRSEENIAFRRGAATIALHAREADASRASPAPTSHPGDIRVTDPNSGSAVWEGNDN
jgi:1-acyl-sn-glycerol-3-phosphate acyltransferase